MTVTTKTDRDREVVLKILDELGWIAIGQSLGAEADGRFRFQLGSKRCTVGLEITSIYDHSNHTTGNFLNIPTKDVERIREALSAIAA